MLAQAAEESELQTRVRDDPGPSQVRRPSALAEHAHLFLLADAAAHLHACTRQDCWQVVCLFACVHVCA